MIKKLGIFDSGLGGYSIYHDLMLFGPDIEYVLYADQAHAPYGNQSPQAIVDLAINALAWFEKQGISDVLLACNTVSSVALAALEKHYPQMNIYGIIELTLSQVDPNKSLGVVSTQATYDSHEYPRQALNENIQSKALVQLVDFIEKGESMELMDGYLERELQEFQACDQLILACTHYPLVLNLFSKHFPGKILDSRLPVRNFFSSRAQGLEKKGSIYTSADPNLMQKQINNLFAVSEKVRGI